MLASTDETSDSNVHATGLGSEMQPLGEWEIKARGQYYIQYFILPSFESPFFCPQAPIQ